MIRQPLRLIPKGTTLPILSGPNRGRRWVVGSSIHGCWLGAYERKNALLLASLCQPGMTVYDVGANVGYFTILFATAVGERGRVIAFEPDPQNLLALNRHASLNKLSNVVAVGSAVTNRAGETNFDCSASMGKVAGDGALKVSTCRLDDYPIPDFVKMDIEGGEVAALQGAGDILRAKQTTWFIELHGTGGPCAAVLQEHGYKLELIGDHHLLATP